MLYYFYKLATFCEMGAFTAEKFTQANVIFQIHTELFKRTFTATGPGVIRGTQMELALMDNAVFSFVIHFLCIGYYISDYVCGYKVTQI